MHRNDKFGAFHNKCSKHRQTAHDLHTWFAKCLRVDGIFDHLLWTVTFAIAVWQICPLNFKLKLKLN